MPKTPLTMLTADVQRRRSTLVPVSTLPAAEVQAQAILQTRLEKGHFSKTVTPEGTSSPMSVIPTELGTGPPEFHLDKPKGDYSFLIASMLVAALGLALCYASSLLALAASLAASLASSLAESEPCLLYTSPSPRD